MCDVVYESREDLKQKKKCPKYVDRFATKRTVIFGRTLDAVEQKKRKMELENLEHFCPIHKDTDDYR